MGNSSDEDGKRQINKGVFLKYKEEITQYNITTLTQISQLGLICSFVLLLLSLPPFHFLDLIYGYLGIFIMFCVVCFLCKTVLNKHRNLVLPSYYFFIIILLCTAAAMGTCWGKDTNAVIFVMMIIIIPLFIIDKPIRLNIVFGVMSILFCLAAWYYKSAMLLKLDLTNCVVSYLLSIIISRQNMRMRLSDIIIKRELKIQNDMDILTKLKNRGSFERIVERYIENSSENAVMIVIDVDDFKNINDTKGHVYGDMVLQAISDVLKNAFRSTDIVSRLGGDEFIVFLVSIDRIDIIINKMNSILSQVKKLKLNEDYLEVTVSAGMSQYPKDAMSFEKLYECADLALYHSKRREKGSFSVYDKRWNAKEM